MPNDPYFRNQYALSKIQLPLAWDIFNLVKTTEIVVAVLDTGVKDDPLHPDLEGKVFKGMDFTTTPPTTNIDDKHGHGTHIAGIIGATINNSLGIAGINPKVKLLIVKVLNNKGEGKANWVAAGIKYSAPLARIMNLSFGTENPTPSEIQIIKDAINEASNCIIVAASGNSGIPQIAFPARYEPVISVGSVDQHDKKSAFSNYGDNLDFITPGENIISTYLEPEYLTQNGTSMACAIVSGIISLVLSINPSLTKNEVETILKETIDDVEKPGYDIYTGYGRINAYTAVYQLVKGKKYEIAKIIPIPNPFHIKEDKMVSFVIPRNFAGPKIEFRIFNFAAEEVVRIEEPSWNGKTREGDEVPTGLYFITMKNEHYFFTGKFTVINE